MRARIRDVHGLSPSPCWAGAGGNAAFWTCRKPFTCLAVRSFGSCFVLKKSESHLACLILKLLPGVCYEFLPKHSTQGHHATAEARLLVWAPGLGAQQRGVERQSVLSPPSGVARRHLCGPAVAHSSGDQSAAVIFRFQRCLRSACVGP